jgi:prepilin-type processing-associated H-X9-DG protein
LLVVIAIIAILAAILFPVFAQAREKARAATCMSNCKQVALGVLMYAQDYDERLMPWVHYDRPGGVRLGPADRNPARYYVCHGGAGGCGVFWCWMDAVLPYVKNDQVFACPSFPNQQAPSNTTAHHLGINRVNYTGLNGNPPDALAAIQEPAGKILIGDGYKGWFIYIDAGDMIVMARYPPDQVSVPNGNYLLPHAAGRNFIFFDGHVKWIHYQNPLMTNRAPAWN